MSDTHELSWQQVVDQARQRWADALAGQSGDYATSEHRQYSSEEIHDELRVILRDSERFHLERPEQGINAIRVATMAADPRDRARVSGALGTLGHVAGDLALWLVDMADRDSFGAALAVARRVIDGDPAEVQLIAALSERIRAYASGSFPNETGPSARRAAGHAKARARERNVRGALTLAEMEARLRSCLTAATASATMTRLIWQEVQRLTTIPAADESDRLVDDDQFLFESWTDPRESRHSAAFVRQVSWIDAEGEYVGMTQLSCRLDFDGHPPAETLWSDGDATRWVREVEASTAFHALPDAPHSVAITLDDV